MNILVCAKRVPDTGAKMILTEDEQQIETRNLGFTVSPHEECAMEEAAQLIEKHGGQATGLILGPAAASEQLRDGLAKGLTGAVLLESEDEWDPISTSNAIMEAVRELEEGEGAFDLLLFGNEAADSGDYQVGVRVAYGLGLPCVTGIKDLEIQDGAAIAKREIPGGWEVYEVPLPAVLTVKEGINVPRYPSLRGRMMAKKVEIQRFQPEATGGGLRKVRLLKPAEEGAEATILGEGPEAVPEIVKLLRELEVIES